MPKPVFGLILLTLGALTLVSPARLHAWNLGPGGLGPAVLPTPAAPLSSPPGADLKGDGQSETLTVAQGRATILEAGRAVWQSPADWQVLQAAFTDLNRDGRPEVAMLVWRAFQPWPVDRWLPAGGRIQDFHDAAGQSCHLILIGWRHEGQYGELWAGSALAEPLRAFAAADLNGDGAQELLTLDGRYADPRSAPARELKVWEWNGFGFSVVTSLTGTFDRMTLVRDMHGNTFVLTP
jgi:hypothetical protein